VGLIIAGIITTYMYSQNKPAKTCPNGYTTVYRSQDPHPAVLCCPTNDKRTCIDNSGKGWCAPDPQSVRTNVPLCLY
jgi:hypothetical protein